MKNGGFLVFAQCDFFEQVLSLEVGPNLPAEGILNWRPKPASPATVFTDFATAKSAIDRTEHYRLAFNSKHAEKRNCSIIPVALAKKKPATTTPKRKGAKV